MNTDDADTPWPAWARWLRGQRQGSERGVGDTIETFLGAGGRAAKALLLALGVECGCCDRRERLNQRFPYTASTELRSADGQ